MNIKRTVFVVGALALVSGPSALAQDEPFREIVNITGDLYRATNNAHHNVFLVTGGGIILTDPISTDFANWLKGELDERFGVPVRYVLYSHYHDDHASGGAVFEDTAEFIGHENTLVNLAAEEGNEVFAEVRPPDRTYSDLTSVTLGNKTVEMIHALPSHSNDSSIIHFPAERAVFAVDFVNVRRVPFQTMNGWGPISSWIDANHHLQSALGYDFVIPGHGPIGTKSDVDDTTRYLEELLAAVTEAVDAGMSLEEAQTAVLMEDYSDWAQYDAWRAMNVQGVYESLTAE